MTKIQLKIILISVVCLFVLLHFGFKEVIGQTVTSLIQKFKNDPTLDALDADNLVIIALRGLPGQDGSYATTKCDPPTFDNLFTVLPAGLPPYTWKADNPELVTIKTTPKGFSAIIVPKYEGKTIVRVREKTGLQGLIKLDLNECPYPEPEPIYDSWKFFLISPPSPLLGLGQVGPSPEVAELWQIEGEPGIYYIDRTTNKKHPLLDWSVFQSHKFKVNEVAIVDRQTLNTYPTGEPLKLKDGTLAKLKDSDTIYLVEGGKVRPFKTWLAFGRGGYKLRDVYTVPKKVLDLHPLGTPIE